MTALGFAKLTPTVMTILPSLVSMGVPSAIVFGFPALSSIAILPSL